MDSRISIKSQEQYYNDLVELVQKFPFKDGLEIGCAWGISTKAFLSSGGNLTSVDNGSYPKVYETARAQAEDYFDRWKFVGMDSADYFAQGQAKTGTFDFVYIDGDHSYTYAHHDIIGGWNVLRPDGILAVDDVANKNNRPGSSDPFGVSIAAFEHWINNPNIKEVGMVGRLLWFKK